MCKGPLTQDVDGEANDYTLKEGEKSFWITIDDIALYITRHIDGKHGPSGVIVEFIPAGEGTAPPLETVFVPFDKAKEAKS